MSTVDINKQVIAVMLRPNPGTYAVTLFGADMGKYNTRNSEAIAWEGTLHVQADCALDAVRKVGSPDGVVVLGCNVEYLENDSRIGDDNVVYISGFRSIKEVGNES